MGGRLSRRPHGMLAGVVLAAATCVADGVCADIGFARSGPFEICVNGAYAAWLQSQAELLANEDPRAQSVDDAVVAGWAVATLNDCSKKGAAEAGSVEHFGRYMARWREHVFDVATSIRRRGQSD